MWRTQELQTVWLVRKKQYFIDLDYLYKQWVDLRVFIAIHKTNKQNTFEIFNPLGFVHRPAFKS
jgi:hypothetical protein